MDRVEAIIIGAGAVGLAIGRDLALRGVETIVLEAEAAIGQGTSSRNSEVIHAGMYYPTGSLKARFCVEGRRRLYDYCAAKGIAHVKRGKLIVATSPDEHPALEVIARRAEANGLTGADALVRLSGAEAMAMEPALRATAALYSPETGVMDSHGVMLNYRGDLEAAGGAVALETRFMGARPAEGGFVVDVANADGSRTELGCALLVNAAGLGATTVARAIQGLDPARVRPTHLSRGCYFTLSGRNPFQRLIYPVPPEASLGIHLTIDVGGQAKFGPDHDWIETIDYHVDPARASSFYASIRRYYPDLADDALSPAYAGIRPKVERPGGANTDFVISGPEDHGMAGLVNLFGIESPGLTASLALAEAVSRRLGRAP